MTSHSILIVMGSLFFDLLYINIAPLVFLSPPLPLPPTMPLSLLFLSLSSFPPLYRVAGDNDYWGVRAHKHNIETIGVCLCCLLLGEERINHQPNDQFFHVD